MDTARFLLLDEGRKKAEIAYVDKVAAIFGDDLIAYFPLWEAGGSVADNYEGTAARDGGYIGVTLGQTGIGDGHTSPLFDGTNDYVDIYSASFNTAFKGNELTIAIWAADEAGDVWSDDANRQLFRIEVDGDNLVDLRKNTDNEIRCNTVGGSTWSSPAGVDCSAYGTSFYHFALTRSKTDDEVMFYIAGSQAGATVTGLGTYAGNIESTYCTIGSYSTAPWYAWSGLLAHMVIGSAALGASDIALLATV